MKKIGLYSTQTCRFSQSAKILLIEIGISYLEINIAYDPKLRSEMIRKANGMLTVLKIYVNNAHLGGFSELYAMQQFGKHEKLLKD